MHTLALASTITLAGPNWDTGLLGMIKNAMQVVAVIVVLLAVLKGVKEVTGGKPANAAKWVGGSLLLAAILWSPTIINSMLDTGANVTKTGVQSVTDIVNQSTDSSTAGTSAGR